jgi:perosamine synthetase
MTDPVVRWWRTDLGDDESGAVAAAIRGGRVNFGREGEAFEEELARYIGAPHALATTSGSVALLLALRDCGVGPGDEVIVPALTFIAPAHAALWLGATVRLIDVLPHSPLLDPRRIAAALTPRTKAIICTHLNGRAADVAAIRAAAGPVPVIEDCAQALGSSSGARRLGTLGAVATFSFSISKLITTGEGGMLAVSEPERRLRLAKLRNHGTLRIADNVFRELGLNFRLTDLQAAIGRAQLRAVDTKISKLRSVFACYRDMLDGLPFIRLLDRDRPAGEVPLWVEAVCAERDKVVAELRRRGIEAKPFHPCLSDSPHLRARGVFPNAQRFAAEGLILPCGPDQDTGSLERVGAGLRQIAGIVGGLPTVPVPPLVPKER